MTDAAEFAAPLPAPTVLARTARGVGWIVGWRLIARLLGVVNTLTLVRLLLPSDFGLVALGSGFVLAVDTLSALGVEDALIRERAPTPAMYHTALTINALRSGLTALIIAIAAEPVAMFFKEPRLANILLALAIGSLVEGVTNVGMVQFRREMAFAKEFQLQVLPRLISVAVTIVGAVVWRSYWALVAGILAGRISRVAFSYYMHSYRPRFTLSAWRSLSSFSLWTWAASMAQLASGRVDGFVIGRILGSGSVGVYSIGTEIAALPTTELVEPLCRVCFSGFTVARHDGAGVIDAYLRVVATAILITLPAGIGISAIAAPLVHVAVGARWQQAVPIIQILGLVGVPTVLGYVASVLFSAYGLLKRTFGIIAFGVVLRIGLSIPLTERFGLIGAAYGIALAIVLDQMLFIAWSFHHFRISLAALLRQLWRPGVAGALMTMALLTTKLGWAPAGGIAQLIRAVALGAVVYTGTLISLWVLSGRKRGAETDMMDAIIQISGQLLTRMRSLRGRALRAG